MLSGEIQIRVRYAETDRMGLLHHANYLVYFEQARTELLRSRGAAYKEMEDQGFFLVIAKVEVKYAGKPWGTSLDTEVYGIPAGTTCEFWVVGRDGRRWQAGSWTVASTYQDSWYQGSSSIPASEVHGFEITSGGKVLIHLNAT